MLYIWFKVAVYTVTEIQKTSEAAGRGGLVVWFGFCGGFFESHVGLFSFDPDVKRNCSPFTIAW